MHVPALSTRVPLTKTGSDSTRRPERGAVDNSHTTLRLLPRDTDASSPKRLSRPIRLLRTPWRLRVFRSQLLLTVFTPTSRTAAHTSDLRLGGHPLREASRVDVQLGVVHPRCSIHPSCLASIFLLVSTSSPLSACPLFFFTHGSRLIKCTIAFCARGELRNWEERSENGDFQVKAEAYIQPPAHPFIFHYRSLSSAAERSWLENSYVPWERSGLAGVCSMRAEVLSAAWGVHSWCSVACKIEYCVARATDVLQSGGG
ncbi:hypothetical protein B0H13DRAFT_2349058 [Mycena leptocephala]|nr:hypothetical protein B0H13DRAFT_2349058 [Mycena leptocephala]